MVRPLMERRGDQILAQTPMGRLGRPEEVARTVVFLASEWASFITGETVHVNGGLYMA
jgi:3-oxoacyl-[acyl-carrier protein] reductase